MWAGDLVTTPAWRFSGTVTKEAQSILRSG
jgi:hypothetical protein